MQVISFLFAQQIHLSVCPCGLTCVLIANLLAGLGGPLAAVVLDPLCGRVGLIVEGQLGRVQPIRNIQEAAHADHKTASWKEKENKTEKLYFACENKIIKKNL